MLAGTGGDGYAYLLLLKLNDHQEEYASLITIKKKRVTPEKQDQLEKKKKPPETVIYWNSAPPTLSLLFYQLPIKTRRDIAFHLIFFLFLDG